MPETIIQSVLTRKISLEVLVKWLNDEVIEDTPEYNALLCYSRSEFVAYFLSFLRRQTDSVLQTNSTALNSIQHQGTPEKILGRKHQRSVSEPTSEVDGQKHNDSLSVKNDRHRSHDSPNRDRSAQKKAGRRVKTKLFSDTDRSNQSLNLSVSSSKTDSDESRLSCGVERLVLSSTPLKNGSPTDYYPNPLTSPVTPQSKSFGYERCDTPRSGHRHSRTQDKSLFGDFLANAQVKSAKKKRATPKNISSEADDSKVIDLSSSDMFPEIGVRKASSLRSEKKRIKPTNIDTTPQKSFSLISFNSETFQQPSPLALEENQAFKQQKLQPKELANSFDVERSILKQERQKLMEKFNVLNTSSNQKSPQTPTIKVTKKDSFETKTFTNADSTKVTFKEEIDILVEIYKILLQDNMVLSLSSEIYYLISIIMSQQYEDDYLEFESKLNQQNVQFILKTIHNSTHFAVKSLWHQRLTLEFMLDKNSLKVLGENKKVRSFYPDLAKFLLNLYGVKCEADCSRVEKTVSVIVLQNRYTNGMVCFNFETDNADNFPSLLSFQNFKKQRDMFYEILRWYNETQQSGSSKSTFRSRVKALISLAVSPLNHAHLARLCTSHMLAECLPSTPQESKLSKLHRRLTGPAARESHRLPTFTDKENFYKEFIIFAENESFRAHLRDSLSTEVCVLNAKPIGNSDDRATMTSADIARQYADLLLRLRLVSKFLGFLTALPYTQLPAEYSTKTGAMHSAIQREQKHVAPKERVLESELAMRNYIQPPIDLKGILAESNEKARLCITIPWTVQYLSMLDYTTLRTAYHQQLLAYLFEIYTLKLKPRNECMKLKTVIFLKLTLGWLFDLPQFPRDLFYTSLKFDTTASLVSEENVDSLELIDESILFDVCPFLRDINVLLLTCRPAQELKEGGSFRHITPVTMSLNPEERIRNKEKEIQARLEEEFLKAQPSSTRRVLELATERVTSSCVKCLAGAARDARARGRVAAQRAVAGGHATDPVQTVRDMYSSQLDALRSSALETSRRLIAERAGMALHALLAPGSNKKVTEQQQIPFPQTDPVQTVRDMYSSQLDALRSSALETSRRLIAERAGMALHALLAPGSNKKVTEQQQIPFPQTDPVQTVRDMYSSQLDALRSSALETSRRLIAERAGMALHALLAPGSNKKVTEQQQIPFPQTDPVQTVRDMYSSQLDALRSSALETSRRLIAERAGMALHALLAPGSNKKVTEQQQIPFPQTDPVQTVRDMYSSQLDALRSSALETSRRLIAERAGMALHALLAPGSNKKALEAVLVRSCLNRVNKWICDHWDSTDVLCKDIEGEVKNLLVLGDNVLLEDATHTESAGSMTLPDEQFYRVNVSPSAVIIDLKEQICLLLEYCAPSSLEQCLSLSALVCARGNVFTRAPTQRALVQLTRELVVVVVSRKPDLIKEALLNQLHNIWNQCCPDRKRNNSPVEESSATRPESPERDFALDDRMPTPTSDEEESGVTSAKTVVLNDASSDKSDKTESTAKEQIFTTPVKKNTEQTEQVLTKPEHISSQDIKVMTKSELSNAKVEKSSTQTEIAEPSDSFLECFDRMLCPRNIVLLSNTRCEGSKVWEAMATVLVFMLKNDYLTEDSLTEQCLAVYRQEWPQSTLRHLSACMKSVSRQWSRGSKFTLFLELLAEYCGDLDS